MSLSRLERRSALTMPLLYLADFGPGDLSVLSKQLGIIPTGQAIFVIRRSQNEFFKVTAAFSIKDFARLVIDTQSIVPAKIGTALFDETG